jgi:photosystem II stability/assembly factor-like uncharacterized protein
MTKIQFLNENTGWTVSSFGEVFKSTNSGINWSQIGNLATYLSSVCFLNQNTGFTGNVFGEIFKTTNEGMNWSVYNTSTYNWVADFFFINDNTGWAAGEQRMILKTTNAGNNWEIKNSGIYGLYDLEFIYDGFNFPQIGYAAGSYGTIIKTMNGGENWFSLNSNAYTRFYSIDFINENTGWVCGEFGSVLKTTNGGNVFIQKLTNEIPSGFILHQNYPNPFNNSTVIMLDVPVRTKTEINIYDILGRKVEILCNEELETGKYKFIWNSGNLSSGIYFCKMTAGKFSDVKRMVLLK